VAEVKQPNRSFHRIADAPGEFFVGREEEVSMVNQLSEAWLEFCRRGHISQGNQRRSVESCLGADGTVRGHYSDLPLDPTLLPTHSMYPSHDHTTVPRDDREMVVDARVINDMKSHLSEAEFWLVVEHLFAVGVAKGCIPSGAPRRLSDTWSPVRHF